MEIHVHHEPVVDDFMSYIDRRAEHFERALDDLYRALDTGAEAAGIGQIYLHGRHDTPFYACHQGKAPSSPRNPEGTSGEMRWQKSQARPGRVW